MYKDISATTMTLQEVFDSFDNDFHRTPQKNKKRKQAYIYQTGSAASSAGTTVSRSDMISPNNSKLEFTSTFSNERQVKTFNSSRRIGTTPIKDQEINHNHFKLGVSCIGNASEEVNIQNEIRREQEERKEIIEGYDKEIEETRRIDEQSSIQMQLNNDYQNSESNKYEYQVEEEVVNEEEEYSGQSSYLQQQCDYEKIEEEYDFNNQINNENDNEKSRSYGEDDEGDDYEDDNNNYDDMESEESNNSNENPENGYDKENKDPLDKQIPQANLHTPLGIRRSEIISSQSQRPAPFYVETSENGEMNNNSASINNRTKISTISILENDSVQQNNILGSAIRSAIYSSASQNQRTPLRDITSGSPLVSRWEHSASLSSTKQAKNQQQQFSSGKGKNCIPAIFYR